MHQEAPICTPRSASPPGGDVVWLSGGGRRFRGVAAQRPSAAILYVMNLTPVLVAILCLALAGCGGIVVPKSANASLSVNTQGISFGAVLLNSSSTQSIVLTCSGTSPVTITASKISGAGFTITGLVVPTTLNPGQSTTLNLQFLPTVAGAVTGQLTLTTNSLTDPTVQIALTGAGASQSQISAYQVNLTWSAPSGSTDPIAGYDIYRTASGSTQYQMLNGSLDAQTGFTDSGVQSGTTYDYYVTTVNMQGIQSAPSNVAEVTIP